MYAIAAYGVQCLVAGCRSQMQGSGVCVQKEGCCTTRAASLFLVEVMLLCISCNFNSISDLHTTLTKSQAIEIKV